MNDEREVTFTDEERHFVRIALNAKIEQYEKAIDEERGKRHTEVQARRIETWKYFLQGFKRSLARMTEAEKRGQSETEFSGKTEDFGKIFEKDGGVI